MVLQGVRFVGTIAVGATLTRWPSGVAPDPTLLALREKAYRAANFYLRKTGTTRAGQPWLAVRAQALQCQQWLRAALEEPLMAPPWW